MVQVSYLLGFLSIVLNLIINITLMLSGVIGGNLEKYKLLDDNVEEDLKIVESNIGKAEKPIEESKNSQNIVHILRKDKMYTIELEDKSKYKQNKKYDIIYIKRLDKILFLREVKSKRNKNIGKLLITLLRLCEISGVSFVSIFIVGQVISYFY